jgi:hypothetical protein
MTNSHAPVRPQPVLSGWDESSLNQVVVLMRNGSVYLKAIKHRRGKTPDKKTYLLAHNVENDRACLLDEFAICSVSIECETLVWEFTYQPPTTSVLGGAVCLLICCRAPDI